MFSYETGMKVDNVRGVGEKMEVMYTNLEDGSEKMILADLVIAADGANSKIRQSMIPNLVPEYVGYVTWRGSVPETAVSDTTKEVLANRVVLSGLVKAILSRKLLKTLSSLNPRLSPLLKMYTTDTTYHLRTPHQKINSNLYGSGTNTFPSPPRNSKKYSQTPQMSSIQQPYHAEKCNPEFGRKS